MIAKNVFNKAKKPLSTAHREQGSREGRFSFRDVAERLRWKVSNMHGSWLPWSRDECPRQTSHREDHHFVRNARVQPIASSAAIQAQVAPLLGDPVSSRTIRRLLAEGHLGSRCPLRVLQLTPADRRLRLE
ncbi:HTH_Tnp_Tc3_2 domain-containing protein [Trichonephila clavipes]|nr:HTH_Tnp_Tc3_2 domain-containing protein [Trichonephila clavipes]